MHVTLSRKDTSSNTENFILAVENKLLKGNSENARKSFSSVNSVTSKEVNVSNVIPVLIFKTTGALGNVPILRGDLLLKHAKNVRHTIIKT